MSLDGLSSDELMVNENLRFPPATIKINQELTDIALRICSFLNPLEILSALAIEVRQIFELERVVVYRFLSNDNGEILAESVAENIPSISDQQNLGLDLMQFGLLASHPNQVQSISDIYNEPFSPEQMKVLESLNIRAHLVIPIVHQHKTPCLASGCLNGDDVKATSHLWGVMSVQQCSSARQWQGDDIEFLKMLLSHVAIALKQSELYMALRTAMRRHQGAQTKAHQLNLVIQQQFMDHVTQLETCNQRLMEEIAQRNQLEERLFQEKELAQFTLNSIGDAVVTTDLSGRVETMNPVAEKLTGWSADDAKGQALECVLQIIDNDTQTPLESPAKSAFSSGQTVSLPSHAVLISKDGNEYMIEDSAAPIFSRENQMIGAVLVFRDVTQSRRLEKMLSWQATHDSLTGLVNRREFEQQAKDAIDVVQKTDQSFVLCYLDLDRFKVINDTCGHLAGDTLLKQITTIFQQRIRTSDTLARLGGDEFGLLLHHCSISQAQTIAESLVSLIQHHQFIWDGKSYSVGVSIGMVQIDSKFQDLLTILSIADAACYKAKKLGGNNVQASLPSESKQEQSMHYWVKQVHSAVEEERLQLYSQTISSLTQTPNVGMSEVLLRFINHKGQRLLPGSLMLAAEKCHLTSSIDRWVIQTFCETYHHPKNSSPLLYTINLSGESINNALFPQFLIDQIQGNNISPDRICFEITETVAITNLARASDLIHTIKQLGCRFALDDFGTGMSSLAYLKALPVDYLKIDGAFIQHLASSELDYSIVECVNRLSHDMGIQTIAEWVEDEPTLQKLKTIGVDYVQGYGISKPSPLIFL